MKLWMKIQQSAAVAVFYCAGLHLNVLKDTRKGIVTFAALMGYFFILSN